ncbi:UNVERIFIED_CONTAM: hypothetical protein GTU68_013501 [Idotea baltica]|nr:hypothetical protein [Idotea baltica]
MLEHEVRGTLLLAPEGINGTISGAKTSVEKILTYLNSDSRLNPIDVKLSFHDNQPFLRSKVKLKKEIVTMGCEDIDPNRSVGTYVKPENWNALISDPEVLLIDTRNDYECEIGTFKNAANPNTESFREFPAYANDNLDPEKHKKVAMFCTGGIRCEKSTAYLKEQGFEEVYHLKGGILNYLKEVPEEESLWEGECFVFDERVAVNHQLEKGSYDQCHACRYPITEEDKHHSNYQKGVSCHRCFDRLTDQQKQRFAEREKQIQIARRRGEQHLGDDAAKISQKRRQEKTALRQSQRNPLAD